MGQFDIHNTTENAERFEILRPIVGADVAYFIACAWLDIPYRPEISTGSWGKYLSRLEARGDGGKRFTDGETSVEAALEDGQGETERWMRKWGTDNDGNPYSAADYRRLDQIFSSYTDRMRDKGGFDGRAEDVIRLCALLSLRRDKLIRAGGKDNIAEAEKLDAMIRKNLQDENMRRADAKQQEQTIRPDGLIEAAAKQYGITIYSPYDEVMKAIIKKVNEGKKYPHTMDAAEKLLMSIVNCTRGNSDLPPIGKIPPRHKLTGWEHEFDNSPENAAAEKETYDYLQIARDDGQ